MSDTPPSPEPAPPARQLPAPLRSALSAIHSFLRQTSTGLFGWPRQLPLPTVPALLLLALIIVPALELLPPTWSDVTLTVRSRTEVVEFELPPGQPYVWWLPAGSYSLLTASEAAGCAKRNDFDFACEFATPTAITIKNGARAHFELSTAEGAPRFTLTLTPRASAGSAPRSAFEVRSGADDLVVTTAELVAFESQPVEHWRIPLIVTRVQIGDFLRDSVAPAETIGGITPQPIMNEGDVRIFARTPFRHERYLVQQESFDPADVVQIPADADDNGRLLGLLSIDTATGRGFDLTLHTDLAEVFVRRLGAEHRIGVSMWSIVANLPIWLALWLVLASLIGVANYHTSRTNSILGRKEE
jgi:hypothetical protein